MPTADFEYRCERCGRLRTGPGSTSPENACEQLGHIAAYGKPLPQMGACLIIPVRVHFCDGGGAGLERLIGYRVRE